MADGSMKRSNWRPILIFVAVAAIALLIAMAWSEGYFKRREKIALVTWNEDPFWDLVIMGAKDAADEFGVDLTVIRSRPDEASQSQHLRDLLKKGVDAIAVSPNNPRAQATLLDEAASKTVLITFDSDAPNTKRRGFVGTDDYAAGQLTAEEVRGAIPDGGAVIVSVGSIEMVNGRDRRQGLIDGLLDRQFNRGQATDRTDAALKGPKYSIATTVLDSGDPGKATTLIAEALKANPEAKCVVGLFSYSAPAAVKAIEQSGKLGKVKVVGFDEVEETQAGVLSGTIYSSILQDQYRCGYEAVRVLAEIVRGTEQESLGNRGPRMTQLPLNVMYASNVEELRKQKKVRTPATQPAAAISK